MTRRRLLQSAGALFAFAMAGLVVVAMLPPSPGVTKANFDRISEGMTLEEVMTIFDNRRPQIISPGTGALPEDCLYYWVGRNGTAAALMFDSDQKMTTKQWVYPPLLESLRGWVPLRKLWK